MKRSLGSTFLAVIAVTGFSSISTTYADKNTHENSTRQYEITITNLTGGQVLTPALAINHDHQYSLFQIGEAASQGLVTLAETGNPSDAQAEAASMPGVFNTMTDSGPILPGASSKFTIEINKHYKHFSVAGMLASTNDAFYAVSRLHLPKRGEKTVHAHVYDAGSEENNENCAFIPGPPCSEESGNARAPDGAEGMVVMHNGIHNGDNTLTPAKQDWRGPVAKITIKRVH